MLLFTINKDVFIIWNMLKKNNKKESIIINNMYIVLYCVKTAALNTVVLSWLKAFIIIIIIISRGTQYLSAYTDIGAFRNWWSSEFEQWLHSFSLSQMQLMKSHLDQLSYSKHSYQFEGSCCNNAVVIEKETC